MNSMTLLTSLLNISSLATSMLDSVLDFSTAPTPALLVIIQTSKC